jgi:hypothetical protein
MTRPKPSTRVFDNYAQAAGAMGVTKAILRRAKELNCPAFKQGNRIWEDEFLTWYLEHAGELKADEEDELTPQHKKIYEEIRKLKIGNDTKQRLVIPIGEIKSAIGGFAVRTRAMLIQKLENEYPSVVAGLDVPGARVYGKRLNDSILEELRRMGEEIFA